MPWKGLGRFPASPALVPDQNLHQHHFSNKTVQGVCALTFISIAHAKQRGGRYVCETPLGPPTVGGYADFPVTHSLPPVKPPIRPVPAMVGYRSVHLRLPLGTLGASQTQETHTGTGIFNSVSGTLLYPPPTPVPWKILADGQSLLRSDGRGIFLSSLT